MKNHWIVFSLLSGLALSQVPSSKSKVVSGRLYRLHISAWPESPKRVAIRHAGKELAAKTLSPFDPDWTMYWRASSTEAPVADAAIQLEAVEDPLAIESSSNALHPVAIELDRDYHALADERPFFTGKPEEGIHWYRLKNSANAPRIAYLSVEVGDRELPSDIETFILGENQTLKPYRVGGYSYLPEATQTMPGLSSFRVRKLEPGGEYLLRVAANHPAYTLRLRSYSSSEKRSPAQAIEMGMDFLASMGAAWHANVPRRGAVASRETLPHGEIQGCVACHPTVFTMRGYDTALKNGFRDVNPLARQMLIDQLQNHPRPFPGHPGVNWTRTIFSARAISSRVSPWTATLLPYLKLTGTTHWEEEADGAAPNVSPFEIAYSRYLALKEPEIALQIERQPAKNLIDLNWKIVGMAALGKPTGALVETLFEWQRQDGLLPLHFDKNEAGAEFITWHSLWALAKADLQLNDTRVKRLYDLCLSRQKPSGEWQGESSHKAFDTPFRDTQFAVMALSELSRQTPAATVATPSMPEAGKAGALARARELRRIGDRAEIQRLLESSLAVERLAGIRVFWSHFRNLTNDRELLASIIRVAEDKEPILRFYAANALARWYGWQADQTEMATAILRTVSSRIAIETDSTVKGAWKQALYTMIDENEGYLATWNSQIADEGEQEKTLEGLAARRKRVQEALAVVLSSAGPRAKESLLQALWDHPQRHAGLPPDLADRSEVVLPAYFTEYAQGVDTLHRGGYEPHLQTAAFRYRTANRFFKTRVGNDSELPDLGEVEPTLEFELLLCLKSGDGVLVRSTLNALSVFPAGLSGRLAIAVVGLAAGPHAQDVRFVFENDVRGRLKLEQPIEFEKALVQALLGALKPGNADALETLLPALAAVTPGEGLSRNPDLQGRMESLLLRPEGVPLAKALAASAVFPHIADGPLIRTTMMEALSSGDRALETAAVEIFVKSYIAEPTNPVLGKQFADKAQGLVRRRMLDSLDPSRFSLRLSALNRYNPGRDVVLPEDANLFSSDVAQHLISIGMKDQDQQVRRAASELVWNHAELTRFRGAAGKQELPQPDYEYFKQRVQPILTKVTGDGRACVLCHSTQGKFPLRMAGKGGFNEAQSLFNFNSVLREVNLAEPQRSLLLLKPTRPNDNAGDPALHTSTHGGGTRWGKSTREASASEEYETILNWIRGARH